MTGTAHAYDLPAEIDLSALQVRRLGDHVGDLIRTLIFSGHFGPGERLNEYRLAKSLRISRTPIREALNALSAEGLVRLVPGRGAFVASFNAASTTQLVELRMALECMGARLAAERATDEHIARLHELLEQTEGRLHQAGKPYPYALDFHRHILEAAANEPLMRAGNDVLAKLRLARRWSASAGARPREALLEHRAVLQAISRRRPDEADEAMGRHLERSLRSIQSKMPTHDPSATEDAR